MEEHTQGKADADILTKKVNEKTSKFAIAFSFLVFFLWKYSIEEFNLDELLNPFQVLFYLAPVVAVLTVLRALRKKNGLTDKRMETMVSVASILGVILGFIFAKMFELKI